MPPLSSSGIMNGGPVMLMIRVYAFYGRSKNIFCLLSVAFIVTAGLMGFFSGKFISVEKGKNFFHLTLPTQCLYLIASFESVGTGSNMHMCFPIALPSIYSKFFFVPLLADGTLIFTLVLVKALRNIKNYGTDGSSNRLTLVLLEDSAICFVS